MHTLNETNQATLEYMTTLEGVQLTCADCGEVIESEDYENPDGNAICESCSDNYTSCDDCGGVVDVDDVHYTDHGNGNIVCSDCADSYYYRCDDCGEYVSSRRLWVDANMTLCDRCSDDYYICDDCGDVVHMDDVENISEYNYCRYCAPSHRSIIHNYDYRPTPVFYGDSRVGGYYGLELEIDDGNDRREAAGDIQAAGGDCVYLKSDGSLSSDGIEIVTHPATLEHHMLVFPWRNICGEAINNGYRSHDTSSCGLHIHASRTLFGSDYTIQDLNIAKTILLIDFYWEQFIIPFSRRDYSQLRDWAKKPDAKIVKADCEATAIRKARDTSRGDRYKAVNLQNRTTVEFRFFKGTLRRNTIVASIQFIDTLIKYVCRTQLVDLWETSWGDIFSNTPYTELNEYLQQRKLLNETEEV